MTLGLHHWRVQEKAILSLGATHWSVLLGNRKEEGRIYTVVIHYTRVQAYFHENRTRTAHHITFSAYSQLPRCLQNVNENRILTQVKHCHRFHPWCKRQRLSVLEWREVKALTFKKAAENFTNIWIVFFLWLVWTYKAWLTYAVTWDLTSINHRQHFEQGSTFNSL